MPVSDGTATDGLEPSGGELSGREFQSGPIRGGAGTAAMVAVGLAGIVAAQGGYFPQSWGWSSTVSLWVIGTWLVARARTDAVIVPRNGSNRVNCSTARACFIRPW